MPESSPIVLGVDPGTHVTGFGVITQVGTRLIHHHSGAIQTSSRDPLEQRLRKIHDDLLSVIRNTSPTVMVLETVFYRKNVLSALKLSHARGVALLAAAEMGLPVAEYAPAEIKRATVGYGRATKEQVSHMITRLLQIPQEQKVDLHDASDALAIALCHLNLYRTKDRVQRAMRKVESVRTEGMS